MKSYKSSYHNDSGHRVPKNYFKEFEGKLMDNIKADSDLSNNIDSGFKVPNTYFEEFEDQLFTKVSANKPKGLLRRLPSRTFFYYSASVAAVLAIILSTVFLRPAPIETEVSLDLNALEEYLDEEYLEMNLNEFSTFIEDDGFVFDNIKSGRLNKEAVLDYLSENVEEPILIME